MYDNHGLTGSGNEACIIQTEHRLDFPKGLLAGVKASVAEGVERSESNICSLPLQYVVSIPYR